MLTIDRTAGVFLAMLVILIVPLRIAAAQDADTQEVLRYALTDAGFAKYTAATQKLAALPGTAADCDEEDGDSQSINDMVAKLNAKPGAKAALQSAGMTAREYVVFSMSLLQSGLAAWAMKQPGGGLPAGMSKANIEFVNRREADLQKLEGLNRSNGCGDGDQDSGEDSDE
jgi:hypothetical protein